MPQRFFPLTLFTLLIVFAVPVGHAVGAGGFPDLSGLSSEIQKSIESACGYYRRTQSPPEYIQCVKKRLANLNKIEVGPVISSLSPEIQKSIKSACGYYRRTEGPASYARCITRQLERFGSALRQQHYKTPPANNRNPQPSRRSDSAGSGFFVSKLGHVVTNQHIVDQCKTVTVGDNAKKQVIAIVIETDKRNDLALLRILNTQSASVETQHLVAKLGLSITPLASQGHMRSEDVELGEDVVVAGFPFGDIFSNTIKITKGVVSAKLGIGDNTGQFQIDAAVQKGSSGGPIYDENGSIIGVVVSQLNKLKVAKAIGSLPENVNFGIKASKVKQFLNASGLPTKWSKRNTRITTKEIAKIAENQTVMVVCHR